VTIITGYILSLSACYTGIMQLIQECHPPSLLFCGLPLTLRPLPATQFITTLAGHRCDNLSLSPAQAFISEF